MKTKNYSVRVIPEITKTPDPKNEGAFMEKLTYVRTSKPREGSNVDPDQFLNLSIFTPGVTKLGGDTKPAPLVLFRRTHPLLFETIAEMMDDESNYVVVNTKSKVRKLNEPLPGLLRIKPCFDYYPHSPDKNGVDEPLMSNRRQPNGNYKPEKTSIAYVRYFLFDSQVDADDKIFEGNDEVQYKLACARVEKYKVQTAKATEEEIATTESKIEEGEAREAA